MRIYVALFLSGTAALIHELMWVRLLGQLFGHTIFAVQTVLTIFFLGIALGAWIAARIRITRPYLAFAVIEVGIAIWGALLPWIVRILTDVYDRFAPLETETAPAVIMRLLITIAALLVPATLMGATFPIVATATRRIAAVYAINTMGGAAGVWAAAFLVLPRVGVMATILIASALNLLAAACSVGLRPTSQEEEPEAGRRPALHHARVLLFLTGLSALALELLWTRALEQILSGTIYTFAVVLAVFLAGIALGSFVLQRIEPRETTLAIVLAAQAVAIVLTPAVVLVARGVHERLGGGASMEAAVAALLLLIPATLMGMSFPLLVSLGGGSIGRLTAANTLGSVVGPLIAGAVLLPLVGLRTAIVTFAVLTALVAIAVSRRIGAAALLLVFIAFPLATRPLRIAAEEGETLIAYRDDTAATVAVVQRGEEQRLKVNNTYSLGGGRGVFTERRQGHLPMFLHRQPRRVLVLGIGTGNTLGAVSLHKPERLVAADLLPGVVDLASRHFDKTNYGVLRNGSAEVLIADATRIVRSSPETFDLILGDLFHPWQAGVGSLYSSEHFQHVRKRLGANGVFVQWLPLYQLSTRDVQTITRTYLEVFPHAQAWLGNFGASTPILGLAGSNAPIAWHEPSWMNAMNRIGPHLEQVYLHNRVEIYGSFVCDRPLLERFARNAPVNTAYKPVVEFTAASAFFADQLEAEKRQTLKQLIALAADQDRADRARGVAGASYFDHRLGLRAFLVTFIALEEGKYRTAVETAQIAAEKCTEYDLPRRALASIGWDLIDADPSGAAQLFRAALEHDPNDQRAREGLQLLTRN